MLFEFSKTKEDNNKQKLNNLLEKIRIKKNNNNNLIDNNEKERENDNINDINKNNNKTMKNKIPFNQKILNKIIEEVKGEKNDIEKVVNRKLMNKKELFRNSLLNNNIKKYDTNTYK